MEDAADDAPAARPPPSLHLPAFWPETPAAWFAHAESRFRLRHIEEETVKYDYLVAALNKDSLRLVLDVVADPGETPYTALKERLVTSHELTDFQRIERIFMLENLGGRKPSELLSIMMEFCPRGEERSKFFAFLFLQRLPKELRIQLGNDEVLELRTLAAKADKLWALHAHQQHGTINAACEDTAESEPAPVAAVNSSRNQQRNRGGNRQRGGGNRSNRGRGGQTPAATASPAAAGPAEIAREGAGLCRAHWRYGDKAFSCEQPCNWQGN